MKDIVSENAMSIIRKMQQYELDESIIYEKIAKFAKGDENKKTLRELSKKEMDHYRIWKKYTGEEMKPRFALIMFYVLTARLLGFTFAVKLMERRAEGTQAKYMLIDGVEEAKHMREDEQEREASMLAMLDEESLRYVGSMVLGLSDALVELTGSLAGFTFALRNTRLIALSGLIVGISATFSMASSEFLSAKSEGRTDALKSCLYTGIAYMITVALLILPYMVFGTSQYIAALVCMLAIIIIIIGCFTYYTSVAQSLSFRSRFTEMTVISISVAVISFVVGVLAKKFLGVDV